MSAFCVFVVAGLLLGGHFAFAVLRAVHHGRAAAQARASEAQPSALRPGRAFLRGTVETDDERPAIVLTLFEVGHEWRDKEFWVHLWRERSRHIEVRPFTLRLPTGETVRVLPDESMRLIDALETQFFSGADRERRAEIVAGEQVCIEGVLLWKRQTQGGGMYRGGDDGAGFVLRRSRTEPMLVASGHLSPVHQRCRSWYRKAALALGVLVFLVHAGLFPAYPWLLVSGRAAIARVTGQETYTAREGRRPVTRHKLIAVIERSDGPPVTVEGAVAPAIHGMAKRGELREVMARFVPSRPHIHHLGAAPTVSEVSGHGSLVLCIVAVGLFWLLRVLTAPWYDQQRVTSGGTGSLTVSVQKDEEAQRRDQAARAEPQKGPDRA